MTAGIDRESWVWNALGTKPPAGDEVAVAGEQPIASYHNGAMHAITTDIKALDNSLADHNVEHQAGGADQIDLQNLKVNKILALNAETASSGNDEYRWVDPATSNTRLRYDLATDSFRQLPAFSVSPKFNQGIDLAGAIRAGDGTVLYDQTTQKFNYAEEADHALDADESVESDYLIEYGTDANGNTTETRHPPGDFLQVDSSPTLENTWTFNQTIKGDISGNAATADSATSADSATNADYATNAGDADTVDGYHASGIIDEAANQASKEWKDITLVTDSDATTTFDWSYSIPSTDPVYDQYRIMVYHENHSTRKIFQKLWLQNDYRNRYSFISAHDTDFSEQFKWYNHPQNDHFNVAGVKAGQSSTHEFRISCPRAVNAPDHHYPGFTTLEYGTDSDMHTTAWYGNLKTSYSVVDTFEFEGLDLGTGFIKLQGRDLR